MSAPATWPAKFFTPATFSPEFAAGQLAPEDFIFQVQADRLRSDARLLEIFETPARIKALPLITPLDAGSVNQLLVTPNVSAFTQAPTSLNVQEFTVYCVVVHEAMYSTRPVVPGEATVLSVLGEIRRVLDEVANKRLRVVIDGLQYTLAKWSRPGPALAFKPEQHPETGQWVGFTVQPWIYGFDVDVNTRKISTLPGA